jgi:hypothetical protein
MANYFSIADGDFAKPGTFGLTIDSADTHNGTASRPITPTPANLIPFYVAANSYPVYGVAVNLYNRAADPTGELTLTINGPTGNISTETYNISLFTSYDGTNNLITLHPQNWQVLKLTTPLELLDAGFYTVSLSATNAGEISLVGSDAGVDVINNAELKLTGALVDNNPFTSSSEQSIQGTLEATFNPPVFGFNDDDFTVEGYFYFHPSSGASGWLDEWNPLVNFGDGWRKGKYAAWGLTYNSTEERIYFWRYAFSNPRRILDQNFYAKFKFDLNQWYHVAVSRNNSKLSIWVNGTCIGIQTYNDTYYAAIKRQKLKIGTFFRDNTQHTSSLSVSNIKLTKGRGIYAPDFVRPVNPVSLKINTPFLYADPYTDYYLATDTGLSQTSRAFDIDAIVINSKNDLRFIKLGSAGTSLSTDVPYVFPSSSDRSIRYPGTSVHNTDVSYGNFPTGDFTMETWIKPTTLGASHVVCVYSSAFSTSASFYLFSLEIQNSLVTGYVASGTTKYSISDTTPIVVNVWTHVALVRQNQTLRLFVNGVQVGTRSIPNKLNSITSPAQPTLTVGGEKNNTKQYIGYIANMRFNQGLALYTSNFDTIPVTDGVNISSPAPVSSITSQSLLPGSLTLLPAVYNASVPAENYFNSITLATSTDSPFLAGSENSLNFVRSQSDYITTLLNPNHITLIGDTDFTLEAWVKLNTIPTAGTWQNSFVLFRVGSPSATDGYSLVINSTKIFINTYADAVRLEYNHDMVVDTWYHIALVRKAGAATIYKNGVATGPSMPFESTASTVYSYTLNANANVYIGSETKQGAYFDGKISNIRFTRGLAVYTSDFSTSAPPNGVDLSSPTPVSAITNTTGTGIWKSRAIALPSSNVPHPGVRSSTYFDGNINEGITYRLPLDTPNVYLGKNFTVECWVNVTEVNNNVSIFSTSITSGSTPVNTTAGDGLSLSFESSNTQLVVKGDVTIKSSFNLPLNTWVHIAVTRDAGTLNLYLDGVLNTTAAIPSSVINTVAVNVFRLGHRNGASPKSFSGYIADFRVVPGEAVYPVASFPTTLDTNALPVIPAKTITERYKKNWSYTPFTVSSQSPPSFTSDTISLLFTGGSYNTGAFVTLDSNYTLEAWVNISSSPSNWGTPIFTIGSLDIGVFNVGSSYRIRILDYSGSCRYDAGGILVNVPARIDSTTNVAQYNQWAHIAVCRKQNQFNIFVNGSPISTTVRYCGSPALKTFAPARLYVTAPTGSLVSNVRFISGEAKYITSNPATSFSVPDAPFDPSYPNTTYLLKSPIVKPLFDPTLLNESMYFYDVAPRQSTHSYSINSGDVSEDTDWALEYWMLPTRSSIVDEVWFDGYTGGTNGIAFGINPNTARGWTDAATRDRRLWLRDAALGGNHTISSEQCIRYNEWNHIAVSYTSGNNTLNVYVNGSLQITYTRTTTTRFNYLSIGYAYGATASGTGAYGAVHSMHIYRGEYINAVPTAPFEASSNTLFLLKYPFADILTGGFDSINLANGTATPFTDSLNEPLGGSILFNRLASSRITRTHINEDLQDKSPYSVEGYFYLLEDTSANSNTLYLWRNHDTSFYRYLGLKSMTLIFGENGATPSEILVASGPLETHQWYYFAVCRDSSRTVRLYLSDTTTNVAKFIGSAETSTNSTYSDDYSDVNYNTYSLIGEGLQGYMANIKESRVALYTADDDVTYIRQPLVVDDNTVSVIKDPYISKEYSYRESVSSLLLKQNVNAFSADTPFSDNRDGSISKSYAVVPADFNPDLNLNTKAFTLEWWDKINAFSKNFFPVIQLGSTTSSGDILAVRYFQSGTTVKLLLRCNGAQYEFILPKDLSLSSWKHCALTRNDNYVYLYINGIYISRVFIDQLSFTSPQNNGIIGAFYNSSISDDAALITINGNISNVRLVVDEVLYPGDVPSDPLEAIPGTAFLYKAPYNTTYLSNAPVGTVASVDTISPIVFDPSPSLDSSDVDSMIFNNKNFLRITDTGSTYDVGNANEPFTIELWVYALSNIGVQHIISRGGGSNRWGRFGYSYALTLNKDTLTWAGASGSTTFTSLAYPSYGKKYLRQWTHVAISYNGSITRLHINGVEEVTRSTPHSYIYSLRNKGLFKLGDAAAFNNVFSPHRYFGYLSNFRIIKGVSLYDSSTFTPERKLTNTPETVLLLQSPYNNNVEFAFKPSPFGTDDVLPLLDNSKFLKTADPLPAMTGDFTIEFWFYCLRDKYFNTSTKESVLDARSSGTSATPFIVKFHETPGKITLYVGSPITPTNQHFITVGNIVSNTWSHFVIMRKNNSVNLYQDGVLCGSFFHNGIWGGNQLLIGKQYAGMGSGENNFFGYLSNLRIINGSAIYGTNFNVFDIPPTAEPDTTFLLKAGTNLNKSVITTESPSVNSEIDAIRRSDALDTALKEGSPWNVSERDFLTFGYTYRHLRLGPSPSLDFYQKSISIEMWVMRLADIPCEYTTQMLWNCSNGSLYLNCDNVLVYYTSHRRSVTTDIEIPLHEWVHIAFVCDLQDGKNESHLYINGEKNWTFTGTTLLLGPSDGIRSMSFGTWRGEFATSGPGNWKFSGYMSNIRVVTKTPSKAITDQTGNFNLVANSSYTVLDSPDPSLATSIFFDGTTKAFVSSSNITYIFPDQFTIECYIKADLSLVGAYEAIAHNTGNWIIELHTNGSVRFRAVCSTCSTATIEVVTAAGAVVTDTWTHIAVTRNSSNDINLFVDRNLVASISESRIIGKTINKAFTLSYSGGTRFYLSGFKINKSVCLYNDPIINPPFPLTADSSEVVMLVTAGTETDVVELPYKDNFTPPTEALTAIPGTKLLLKAPYNVHNDTEYYQFNADVIQNANPYTNSPAYRFSGRYNGKYWAPDNGADSVVASITESFAYSQQFTFEAWINPTNFTSQPYPPYYNRHFWENYNKYNRGWRCIAAWPGTFFVSLNPSNKLYIDVISKGYYSTKTIASDDWTHIAIVGTKTKIILFINGVISDVISNKMTSRSAPQMFCLGTASGLRYNSGGIYWNCSDATHCAAHFHVSNPYYGLMSDILLAKRQVYQTSLELEGFTYTLASGTIFQYQPDPSYDIYNYQTSSGQKSIVINTTTPNEVDGIYFPGTANVYIKSQPLPAMAGDLLVEFWFKSTRTTATATTVVPEMLLDGRDSNNATPWYVMLSRTKHKSIAFMFGSLIIETDPNTFITNLWYNLAIIRKQGIITLYINGNPITSAPYTTTWPNKPLHIGRSWDGKQPFKGYIYSVRVVKDNTAYATSFDPKTNSAPVHFPTHNIITLGSSVYEGTNVTDSRGVTTRSASLRYNTGMSSSLLSPVSPYSNFDNILHFNYNQSMIIPHNEKMNLASTPWTFEVWLFLPSLSLPYTGTIIRKGENADQSYAIYCNTNKTITFVATGVRIDPTTGARTAVAIPSIPNTTALPTRKWVHILLTSDGYETELFIDGKYNFTYPYAPQYDTTTPLYVGSYGNATALVDGSTFTGYMSNLRLVKNENAYSSAITVPLDPFPDSDVDDTLYDFVTLLLHGNGADDSTSIIDTSKHAHTLIPHGNCRLRAITNKFGFSSIFFGGPGDYITGLSDLNGTTKFDFDFTVEFWVFATAAPQNDQTIISFNILPKTSGFYIRYRTKTLEICSGSTTLISSTKWSLNTWRYVAVSRVSGSLKLYIDGDFIKAVRWTNNCTDGLQYIGRNTASPSFGLIGYIDDLRITNGKGRYTPDFIPPTTPVQAVFNTAIVLQAPYEQYTYGTYAVEGVHISSSLLGDSCEPRLIQLDGNARVNNLYVHNKGTLHISKTIDAELDITGSKGVQITSEGCININ